MSVLSWFVLLVKVSLSFMAEVKTTLSFTKRWEEKGGGRLEKKKTLGGWVGGLEMASKGPAVTMVLLSLVTVGTDRPQC